MLYLVEDKGGIAHMNWDGNRSECDVVHLNRSRGFDLYSLIHAEGWEYLSRGSIGFKGGDVTFHGRHGARFKGSDYQVRCL